LHPVPQGPSSVEVPFRKGAPGVIHLTELARRIADQPATRVGEFGGPGGGPAELAMELLQFPFRQVFGDPAEGAGGGGELPGYDALFRARIGIIDLRKWNEEA
jgi:hypothetical protein